MADFNPDAYIAEKTAKPDAAAFDPDKYLAEKTAPVPAKPEGLIEKGAGVAGDAYKGVLSVVSGGGDSIGSRVPIIGPLGKNLGERFRAGVDWAAHGGDKPYGELLQGIRDQEAADQAQFAKEHPGANATRSLLGGIGAMAIPVPGAGMKGLAGAAVRVGGAATGAATDAALRTEDPNITRQAATLGGGIQAGLEAIPVVGRLAAPLAGKLGTLAQDAAEGVEGFANERAVKAATGQNKAVLKNIAKTKGIDEVGQALNKGDNPVVQFGSSVNTIKDRASEAADQTWSKVEQIYQHADQAAGGKAIDGAEIAAAIRQRAGGIEPLPQNESVIAQMNKAADYFEKKGPMSMSHAQDLKNNFIFKLANPQTHALGTQGNNEIRGAITETMGEAIRRVDPALEQQWASHMNDYGAFASTAGAASDRAVANLSNRFISPSDYATGIGGAVIAGAANQGGGAGGSGLTMAVLSMGHKFLRERGSSMMAVSAKNLAHVMETAPGSLGSAYGLLEKAATESPAALEATHTLLMETDPKYRELLDPKPAQNPHSPLIAPSTDPVQQKRDAIKRRLGK